MISVKRFVCNELGVNTLILSDDSDQCLLIDPGCNHRDKQQEIHDYVQGKHILPRYIVLTHGHFDHLAGLTWARDEFACPVLMHEGDLFLLENASEHAAVFGFRISNPPFPDRTVQEGEQIQFGHSSLQILHVPGHSPGSICLYSAEDNLLVCGDVLFKGSIGRTDLFGGNHPQLIRGIKQKLMWLPRETLVWPGHGEPTAIGEEHDTNPFLQ
jgi:hydroxyacylglutathione hydrolase